MYLLFVPLLFSLFSLSLDKIPGEIQWKIISFINLKDMQSVSQTCKIINNNLKTTGQNKILLEAIEAKNNALAQFSLKNGANVNSRNVHGQTPFMIATANRDTAMMQLCMSYGANIHSVDLNKNTALDYAMFLER